MARKNGQATILPPDQAREPGMKLSPLGELAQLFVDLFTSAKGIRAFARSNQGLEAVAKDLPGENVPVAEMAMALATSLQEHGLVDQALVRLTRIRPHQGEKVRRAAKNLGVGIQVDLISPRPSKNRAWAWTAGGACAALLSGALWWHQPLSTTGSVIILDPDGLDLVILNVVSRRQGKSWNVLLSKHRTGESAARAIFIATFLHGDKEAAIALEQDQFSLCQAKECVSKEIIGDIFQLEGPVALMEVPGVLGQEMPIPTDITPFYIQRDLDGSSLPHIEEPPRIEEPQFILIDEPPLPAR